MSSQSMISQHIQAIDIEHIKNTLLHILDQNKAQDIVDIDIHGNSCIGDHMIVASGSSSRQVSSLAEKVIAALKANGYETIRADGLERGDWAVLDTGDIIVHLFRPEVREYYKIERMWLDYDDSSLKTSHY